MEPAALSVIVDDLEPDCATVLVDVTLDGRPQQFILDTGAPTTQVLLDEQTANWPAVSRAVGTGLLGAADVDLVTAPPLTVAGTTVSDLVVRRVRPEVSAGHGLLGLDVLGEYACVIDLRTRMLHLHSSGTQSVPHVLRQGARGHLYVTPQWGPLRANACIDFGAGITLLDGQFFTEHPELVVPTHQSIGTDGTGVDFDTLTGRLMPYTVAGTTFEEHTAAVAPLPQANGALDAILGYPTLAQARWTLDIPALRFAINPYKG